ncbi:MAG: hypothetical protein QOH01_2575 [Verrucomicrobiota bacterium]|jgi:hypothetical protein
MYPFSINSAAGWGISLNFIPHETITKVENDDCYISG